MELWVHVSRLLMPHLDSDQWKHFILNILLLVGGDATHSFTSILLLHALHTLDRNCTCQNNPRLGFAMFGDCMHFHPSVYRWWCGRLFFSSLHTIILHMCTHFIDRLTHYHSSQIFLSCGWWCRKFFFFFSHTTILTCHPISLIIIHHKFHPNVTCSFICTKLQAPVI